MKLHISTAACRVYRYVRICYLCLGIFLFVLAICVNPTHCFAQGSRVFVVNSLGDEEDPNAGEPNDDGRCDVDPSVPGDSCTLRAAIQNHNANRHLGQNSISFAILNAPGSGSLILRIGSTGLGGLPPVLGSVVITGLNDDGTGGRPRRIEINGSQAPGAVGLQLLGTSTTVELMIINNFSSHGIVISGTPPPGGGMHRIYGMYIGTDSTGSVAHGNGGDGIFIDNTASNIIGGRGLFRNVISGNGGHAIRITGASEISGNFNGARSNIIEGNTIGLDVREEVVIPNAQGGILLEDAPETKVGDTLQFHDNKLAGNNANGITIQGSFSTGISIAGNFIGEGGTGARFSAGILYRGGQHLSVTGNFITNIAGVGVDIFVDAGGNFNLRKNRFEGEMEVGTKFRFGPQQTASIIYENNLHISNSLALDVEESIRGNVNWLVASDTIRGGKAGASFVFQASGLKDFTNNTWQSNAGVAVTQFFNVDEQTQISATMKGQVFADNEMEGVRGRFDVKGTFSYALLGSTLNRNRGSGARFEAYADAGASVDFTSAENRYLLNAGIGLRLVSDGSNFGIVRFFVEHDVFENNTEGGIEFLNSGSLKSVTGNTIRNNAGPGILLSGTSEVHADQNQISGNEIGILVQDASIARIDNNTISENGKGVVVTAVGSPSTIQANSIFANLGPGIDLGNDGITPNDLLDADSGPNGFQNFPILHSVVTQASDILISGVLESTPDAQFRIDFFQSSICNPTGFGEGEIFLGNINAQTDALGKTSFTAILSAGSLPPGFVVTAVATDSIGQSSEFSNCISSGSSESDADLELSKAASSTEVLAGQPFVYTLTLVNQGPGSAAGITVRDVPPIGISYSSTNASLGSYDIGTGIWSIADLQAGQEATLTIEAVGNTAGVFTNTAELMTSSVNDPDSEPGNNDPNEDDQASVPVRITAPELPETESAYRELMFYISGLVAAGQISSNEGALLVVLLNTSLHVYQRGNIRGAMQVLSAFDGVVRLLTRFHRISRQHSQFLLKSSAAIAKLLKSEGKKSAKRGQMGNGETASELRAEQEPVVHPLYPNPVRSQAVLSFDLVKESRVEADLFDQQGRRTGRVLQKLLPAGKHMATFNANRLPSGTYVLVVRINGKTYSQHMMVAR